MNYDKADSINILDEILKEELDDLTAIGTVEIEASVSTTKQNIYNSAINNHIKEEEMIEDSDNSKSAGHGTVEKDGKRNQFDQNPSDVSSSEDDTQDQDSVLSQNSITSGSFDSDSDRESKPNIKTEGKSSIIAPVELNSSSPKKDTSPQMNQILRDARYFLMKSNNEDNVELSKLKGVWSTPPGNETKINQAVKETRNVILIFSVKESGQFSGFARVVGCSTRDGEPIAWILPPGLSHRTLGSTFNLDWISKSELSFNKTQHLFNPWNEGKPVKIGRDGQEIEPHVAAELCRLFPSDLTTDWNKVSSRLKDTINTRTIGRITGPIGSNSTMTYNNGIRGRGFVSRRMPRGRFTAPMQHASSRSFDYGRGRKRSFEDDYGDYGSRPKRTRGSYDSYSGGYTDGSDRYYRDSTSTYSPSLKGSSRYQEFGAREYHHPPPMAPMPYPPPPPFDSLPPPPRYYDGPPLPEFPTTSSRLHVRDRRSSSPYQKSINEFLRRADSGERSSHRDHDRERKYYRH